MKFSQRPSVISCVSCIVMILTLAWLTVSLPFVYSAQQTIKAELSVYVDTPSGDNEEENDNPLTNTTEEKTSNSISSVAEEYLHDTHSFEHSSDLLSKVYKVENTAPYNAFHGELISPPPDIY